MSTAQVVYGMMLFGLCGMAIASAAVLISSLLELKRRWRIRLGYRVGFHPDQGYVRMFGLAVIRRKIAGMSGFMVAMGIIAATTLLLFSVPAVSGMLKMSPEQFLKDFQEFQQQRR